MYLYHEVQRKAQAEIKAVIGPHRLPTYSDIKNLPYISAVLKETLRWHPIVPFGIPHTTTEDLEYRGYFIPKGTMLSPLTWYEERA